MSIPIVSCDRPRGSGSLAALLLLAVLAICVPGFARAADWLRADTHNFIIYSDGDANQLKEFATSAERFDGVLRQIANLPVQDKVNRLTIFLVRSKGSVAKLFGQKHVVGFYSTDSEGSFAVSHRSQPRGKYALSAQQVLFHEYAHHFMYRNFSFSYPAWYSEGFAEYVSTVSFTPDGGWTFGYPTLHRVRKLAKTDFPVAKILGISGEEVAKREITTFYAWSWALVHMLNSDPGRAGQLQAYLKAFGSGVAPAEAARVFGDLDQLDRELRIYAASEMPYSASNAPIAVRDGVTITALGPVTSKLTELAMLRRIGKQREQARDGLLALAKRAPDDPEVLYQLARAEYDIGKRGDRPGMERAEGWIDQALALDAEHVRANVLKADLMFRRLSGTGASQMEWATARAYISAAIRLDPEDPLALIAFFQSFAAQGIDPPVSAYDAMAKAFDLAPESKEVRLLYAFSLARKGDFDGAIAAVEVMAYDPHGASVGQKALAHLRQIRSMNLPLAAYDIGMADTADDDGD